MKIYDVFLTTFLNMFVLLIFPACCLFYVYMIKKRIDLIETQFIYLNTRVRKLEKIALEPAGTIYSVDGAIEVEISKPFNNVNYTAKSSSNDTR